MSIGLALFAFSTILGWSYYGERSLAYLAGVTSRIGLGTAVLNLPYRPMLPTAKAIATLQEPDEGTIALGELDVLRRKDEVRRILSSRRTADTDLEAPELSGSH